VIVAARHHKRVERRVVHVASTVFIEEALDRAVLLRRLMLVEAADQAGRDAGRAFHRRPDREFDLGLAFAFGCGSNSAQARRATGNSGDCTLTATPPFAAGSALVTVGGTPKHQTRSSAAGSACRHVPHVGFVALTSHP
jgi:hypothetical protein